MDQQMPRTRHPMVSDIYAQLAHVHWGTGAVSEQSPIAPAGIACEDACIVEIPSDEDPTQLRKALAWWDVGTMRPQYYSYKALSDGRFKLLDGPGAGSVVKFFGWDDDVAAARQAKYKEAEDDGYIVDPTRMRAWCDRRRISEVWIPNFPL